MHGATPLRQKSLLRFFMGGSVDDGKSTLIGRLLHETGSVADDELAALTRDSARFGNSGQAIDFALLVDGLEDEREQGITIDVAHRYFSSPRRAFIVADTPGHESYTRNTASGASNADLAIILVDARRGLLPQTRRHAMIAHMVGVRHFVLAVNKLDLVNWDRAVYDRIVEGFRDFAKPLNFASLVPIPLSALNGDRHPPDRDVGSAEPLPVTGWVVVVNPAGQRICGTEPVIGQRAILHRRRSERSPEREHPEYLEALHVAGVRLHGVRRPLGHHNRVSTRARGGAGARELGLPHVHRITGQARGVHRGAGGDLCQVGVSQVMTHPRRPAARVYQRSCRAGPCRIAGGIADMHIQLIQDAGQRRSLPYEVVRGVCGPQRLQLRDDLRQRPGPVSCGRPDRIDGKGVAQRRYREMRFGLQPVRAKVRTAGQLCL